MNKMQMAHDMALELVKIKPELAAWQIADRCFEYADAMQAEAEKRKPTGAPEAIREAHKRIKDKIDFGEPVKIPKEYKRCKQVEVSEWQPDWSQAPEWAKYWHYNSYHSAYWVDAKPEDRGDTAWSFDFLNKRAAEAPSFGYQGNWKNSLRKRPQ